MKEVIKISLIMVIVSAVLVYIWPYAFNGHEVVNCNPDLATTSGCVSKNVWMGNMEQIGIGLGMLAVPFFMGVLLALKQKKGGTLKNIGRTMLVGIGGWWATLTVWEIIWLQPWKTITTPSGDKYNNYNHDAVFGTPLAVAMILFAVVGFLVAYGLANYLGRNVIVQR